jgi:NAD-dependent dihydropyrimidine dehydrogenase PreA subunit
MYLVEEERCTGCGVCLGSCDKGAVSLRNDVAVIDQQRCSECGGCYDACLQNAVRELNGPRRIASSQRPMYGIESPFPLEGKGAAPAPPAAPGLLVKLTGLARRRRS